MSNILYIMLSHGLTVFKSIRSFNPCLLFLIHKRFINFEIHYILKIYALVWSHTVYTSNSSISSGGIL